MQSGPRSEDFLAHNFFSIDKRPRTLLVEIENRTSSTKDPECPRRLLSMVRSKGESDHHLQRDSLEQTCCQKTLWHNPATMSFENMFDQENLSVDDDLTLPFEPSDSSIEPYPADILGTLDLTGRVLQVISVDLVSNRIEACDIECSLTAKLHKNLHHLLENRQLAPKTLFKVKAYRLQTSCDGSIMLTSVELLGRVKTWLADKLQDDEFECNHDVDEECRSAFDRDCLHYNDIFALKLESNHLDCVDIDISAFLDSSDHYLTCPLPSSKLGRVLMRHPVPDLEAAVCLSTPEQTSTPQVESYLSLLQNYLLINDVAVITAGSLRGSVVHVLASVEPPVGKHCEYYLVDVDNSQVTKKLVVSGKHLKAIQIAPPGTELDDRFHKAVSLFNDFESVADDERFCSSRADVKHDSQLEKRQKNRRDGKP